jgi:hypothetical protein
MRDRELRGVKVLSQEALEELPREFPSGIGPTESDQIARSNAAEPRRRSLSYISCHVARRVTRVTRVCCMPRVVRAGFCCAGSRWGSRRALRSTRGPCSMVRRAEKAGGRAHLDADEGVLPGEDRRPSPSEPCVAYRVVNANRCHRAGATRGNVCRVLLRRYLV